MRKKTRLIVIIAGAVFLLGTVGLITGLSTPTDQSKQATRKIGTITVTITDDSKEYPIQLSEQEWKRRLGEFEYHILREAGTEAAFSGKYYDTKKEGTYYSKATGQPLFSSRHKFKSGTGWPSFYRPISWNAIDHKLDNNLWTERIEIVDSSSGSHLGHAFPDGPEPTGLRYCINSAALIFVPKGQEPPKTVKDYLANSS